MCWALLKGKQQSQYEVILQKLQEKMFEKCMDFFNPETINSDFELGFIAAVSIVLPYTLHYENMGLTQTKKKT